MFSTQFSFKNTYLKIMQIIPNALTSIINLTRPSLFIKFSLNLTNSNAIVLQWDPNTPKLPKIQILPGR